MKPRSRFQRVIINVAGISLFCVSALWAAAVLPARVDFYDMSNNHLMYMVFNYNNAGQLTGRTVYMADGTFTREVDLTTDATGNRVSEVSRNFNGDTSFVTRYQHSAGTTSFSIRDQFNLDHVGGEVYYTNADPVNFNLNYKSDNSLAARIQYVKDGTGNLSQVNVYDQAGELQYYGKFSATNAARQSLKNLTALHQTSVTMRGVAGIDLQLNLEVPSHVKCELMTLNGRVAGVILNETVKKGKFLKSFRNGSQIKAANGVYMFIISIDGKVVISSRYLHQSVSGGVK